MKSLRLDETGDLVFEGNELDLIEGAEELAQCCRIGIGTNKGEWFLDPEIGITFSLFLGKQLSEEEMRDELTEGLLQEERIQSVENIEFTIDTKARKMVVAFEAIGTNGETITAEGVRIGAG